jgi:transposase
VRAADTVPAGSRGYDAGRKVNGRKRFIVTDILGLLVAVTVLAACWQDRDGVKGALLATYAATPIRRVFADQGLAGRLVDGARTVLNTTVEIVRKPAGGRGLAVHPRRWVVERTVAWLTAHRRLARDDQTDPATAEHMIRWPAMIGMLSRLTRDRPATRQTRRTFNNTPD